MQVSPNMVRDTVNTNANNDNGVYDIPDINTIFTFACHKFLKILFVGLHCWTSWKNFRDYTINLPISEKKKKRSWEFNKSFSQNATVHIKPDAHLYLHALFFVFWIKYSQKLRNVVPATSSTGNKIQCSCKQTCWCSAKAPDVGVP